jgi:CDP-diacylglycerol--glycerol-3-phosphate 3-phosphatidyltransferase
MSINLPNQITIGRLLLAVVFFALLAQYDHRAGQTWLLDVGFVLFVVAALTDILDGYLARKYDQITSLGRILDPFVDKVLVCGTFVLLAGPSFLSPDGRHVVTGVQAWMVVLILGRELLVTGLRGFSESIGRDFGANVYGKAKMWVQSVTAPTIIIVVAHERTAFSAPFFYWLRYGLLWLTVIVTTLSMTSYLLNARHFLEASRPKGSGCRSVPARREGSADSDAGVQASDAKSGGILSRAAGERAGAEPGPDVASPPATADLRLVGGAAGGRLARATGEHVGTRSSIS